MRKDSWRWEEYEFHISGGTTSSTLSANMEQDLLITALLSSIFLFLESSPPKNSIICHSKKHRILNTWKERQRTLLTLSWGEKGIASDIPLKYLKNSLPIFWFQNWQPYPKKPRKRILGPATTRDNKSTLTTDKTNNSMCNHWSSFSPSVTSERDRSLGQVSLQNPVNSCQIRDKYEIEQSSKQWEEPCSVPRSHVLHFEYFNSWDLWEKPSLKPNQCGQMVQ